MPVDGLCILAEPLPLRVLLDLRDLSLDEADFITLKQSIIPVSVHDMEAVVVPLDDEVGVERDAEVLVVHLKKQNK